MELTTNQLSTEQEPLSFELESFECTRASEAHALVRIAGRWRVRRRRFRRRASTGEELAKPVSLVASAGDSSHSTLPLPDAHPAPLAPDTPWRAAFPVPLDLLRGEGVALALDLGDGVVLELPAPPEGPLGPDGAFEPRDTGAHHDVRRPSIEQELEIRAHAEQALRRELDSLDAELRRVRAESRWLRSELDTADRERAQARELVAQARGDTARERQRVRELEEELAARTEAEAQARDQLTRDQEDLARLRHELTNRERELQHARDEAGTPGAVVEQARRRISTMRRTVAANRQAQARGEVEPGLRGMLTGDRRNRGT
jgi:hypothetical protein